MPLCCKIIAQHAVSNGWRKWETERQVIDAGEYGIVSACLDDALLLPIPCPRLLARIEACPHPNPFSSKHQHRRQSSPISNAARRQLRQSTSNVYDCVHDGKRPIPTGISTRLSPLSNHHAYTSIF